MTAKTVATQASATPVSFKDKVSEAVQAGTLAEVERLEIVDKLTLQGVPFIITGYSFHEGEYGEFVTVKATTEQDEEVGFNDGSTGVKKQIRQYHETRWQSEPELNEEYPASLLAPKGLYLSKYKNQFGTGETYYIK